MLVLTDICSSCGFAIGAQHILFKHLIYRNGGRKTLTPELLRQISDTVGIFEPCCWNIIQGIFCYADVGIPARCRDTKGVILFDPNGAS
jgi:DNA-directed RNA polymerase subunit N (RpoN/RPB10)